MVHMKVLINWIFLSFISLEKSVMASVPDMATMSAYLLASQPWDSKLGALAIRLFGMVRFQNGTRAKKTTYGIALMATLRTWVIFLKNTTPRRKKKNNPPWKKFTISNPNFGGRNERSLIHANSSIAIWIGRIDKYFDIFRSGEASRRFLVHAMKNINKEV